MTHPKVKSKEIQQKVWKVETRKKKKVIIEKNIFESKNRKYLPSIVLLKYFFASFVNIFLWVDDYSKLVNEETGLQLRRESLLTLTSGKSNKIQIVLNFLTVNLCNFSCNHLFNSIWSNVMSKNWELIWLIWVWNFIVLTSIR
jgi:hypothetical protein